MTPLTSGEVKGQQDEETVTREATVLPTCHSGDHWPTNLSLIPPADY